MERLIRDMTETDLPYLLAAQRAGVSTRDRISAEATAAMLREGVLKGLVLECDGDYRACLAYQHEGHYAQVWLFHREGPAGSLQWDAEALWEALEKRLKAAGVRHVVAYVAQEHPKADKLILFYSHFGFFPDLIRVGREIE